MNIKDKKNKKIIKKKNKKRLKEEEERLEYEKTQKLFKPISNFGTDVYKKNLADDFVKLEKLVRTYFIFIIASISTEISRGKAMDPTATLVCFPLSPKIFTSRSEAPLIILGCFE